MKKPSIGRFPRLETILHALLDETTAEMATNLAGLFIEEQGDEPGPIPLQGLAARCGQTGEILQDALREASDAAQRTLGFALIVPEHQNHLAWRDGSGDDMAAEDVTLSRKFAAILTGSIAPRLWVKQDVSGPKPDVQSEAFIALLRDAAKAGGAPFLYRQSNGEEPLRQLEMSSLADAMADGSDVPVYVAADLEPSWTSLDPLIGSLLSAVLHLPSKAILLIPFADQFATEPNSWQEDDSDGVDFSARRSSRKGVTMAAHARLILRLLPHLDLTTVFALPAQVSLPITYASGFAGAVGPLRFDRAHSLTRAITAVPGQILSTATAERLLESMIDPQHAATLLAAADRLVGQQQGEEQQEQKDKARHLRFDATVGRLASSMAPVVERAAWARPKRAEHFDLELFPSDPDLSDYFARADQLRQAGAKFLIDGPAGTGKTALASEFARRMKLAIRECRADRIFGRWWGETEKLIKRAFDEAAADNVLLFFDEADALMTDRARNEGSRHLVIAATSEFLKFLDAHPLPVVAATNFLEDIDKAIIRRFDVVVRTRTLPEDREILAWDRILTLDPPSPFRPMGGTVVADYVLTKRRLDLLNRHEPAFALQTLREVRDARGGAGKPQFGFLS